MFEEKNFQKVRVEFLTPDPISTLVKVFQEREYYWPTESTYGYKPYVEHEPEQARFGPRWTNV